MGNDSSGVLYTHKFTMSCYFLQGGYGSPSGFDRTRNVEIGNKNIVLHHLEEAYTSEHWLVRIYRFAHLHVLLYNKAYNMQVGSMGRYCYQFSTA